MNHDEGLRCFEMAQEALSNQKFEKAIQLAERAIRMLSTDFPEYIEMAKGLLEMARNKNTQNGNKEHDNNRKENLSNDSDSDNTNNNVKDSMFRNKKNSNRDDIDKLEKKCKEIINDTDFYRILGISRDASQDKIKKAFRKLALVYHPDKVKCPSADQAFKKIAEAYQCLADPVKKKNYDTYGYQSNNQSSSIYTEADFMTPEDLIASLFGMHFSSIPTNTRRERVFRVSRNTHRTQERNQAE